VAESGSKAELAELQGLHAELEAAIDQRDAFFIANERFHLRLLEIEGNRWRCQMVNDLRRVMKLNRHHSLFKQGRLADSLGEHRAVMQAIAARDSAGAARLMREHFENGLNAATERR
jgi:DNA-binding GntR family transcriptional regulator